MKFILRWSLFIKERFNPIANTATILMFFAANALYYIVCLSKSKAEFPWVLGFILVWLVFFHMRLFDDIKDYETDKVYNKERPLPRGLVSIKEYGFVTFFCIALEIIIASSLGPAVFTAYVFVLCFTLLMRQEFFIGEWLRHKMELYAVSHTLSSFLIGILVYSLTGNNLYQVPVLAVLFSLGNWFVFNVFEFGRKTFSKDEERIGVDSYSSRLKPWGAFLLISVNILGALFCLLLPSAKVMDTDNFKYLIVSEMALTFIVMLSGVLYCIKNSKGFAGFYRSVISAYLLLHYVLLVFIMVL
ncbi:MAG: UbiA family prenyltransferase [Bacillota bacterium]